MAIIDDDDGNGVAAANPVHAERKRRWRREKKARTNRTARITAQYQHAGA